MTIKIMIVIGDQANHKENKREGEPYKKTKIFIEAFLFHFIKISESYQAIQWLHLKLSLSIRLLIILKFNFFSEAKNKLSAQHKHITQIQQIINKLQRSPVAIKSYSLSVLK